LPAGLILAATPRRADARDVFISRGPALRELPPGATVASGSLRRRGQLLALRPDLKLVDIRGNVETRLKKLQDNAGWHGIVLAAAGLARLNLKLADWGVVAHPFAFGEMLPAPCQAIIGLEVRTNDARVLELLRAINHYTTFQAALAERAFAHVLDGGCRTPIAAHAEVGDNQLTLRGAVFFEDGRVRFRDQIAGDVREAERLGTELAQRAKTVMQ
jgi:hydroxymethylbilane synthase